MEYSERREEIGNRFCEVFPFHSAEFLGSSAGAALFPAVALLNPVRALRAAERAISTAGASGVEVGSGWSEVVKGLEIIAWHGNFFDSAAKLVLEIAAHGTGTSKPRAIVAFSKLYHLLLSGTQKPAPERLKLLKETLASGADSDVRRVVIMALGSALKHRDFTRMGDTSLTGVRDPEKDWVPETLAATADFYEEAFKMLAVIGLHGSAEAETAVETLGSGISGALRPPLPDRLDADFKAIAESKSGLWPIVKSAIKSKMEYDESKLSPQHRESLERWLGYVTPDQSTFENRYRDLVVSPGYHHRKEKDGNFRDLSREEAVAFADECVDGAVDLSSHVDCMLTGVQQQGFSFGERLGLVHPNLGPLLDSMLERLPDLGEEERNLKVLQGIACGLSGNPERRQELLRRLDETPSLGDLLIPVTSSGLLEERDVVRMRTAIIENRVDPKEFNLLAYGSVTGQLDPDSISRELELILDAKPEMAGVLLRVLSMYCHRNEERFHAVSDLLRRLVVHSHLSELDDPLGHDWKTVVNFFVRSEVNKQWYLELTRWIIRRVQTMERYLRTGDLADVAGLLFARAPEIVAPLYSEALDDPDERKVHRLAYFLSKADGWDDESGSPLWELDPERFRAWLKSNPKLIDYLVREMPLCIEVRPEDIDPATLPDGLERTGPIFAWHQHAKILLEEGVASSNLAGALRSNLWSFSSVGSRVPYLEGRKTMMEGLLASEEPRLREVAAELISFLEIEIEHETRIDLNHEAGLM